MHLTKYSPSKLKMISNLNLTQKMTWNLKTKIYRWKSSTVCFTSGSCRLHHDSILTLQICCVGSGGGITVLQKKKRIEQIVVRTCSFLMCLYFLQVTLFFKISFSYKWAHLYLIKHWMPFVFLSMRMIQKSLLLNSHYCFFLNPHYHKKNEEGILLPLSPHHKPKHQSKPHRGEQQLC